MICTLVHIREKKNRTRHTDARACCACPCPCVRMLLRLPVRACCCACPARAYACCYVCPSALARARAYACCYTCLSVLAAARPCRSVSYAYTGPTPSNCTRDPSAFHTHAHGTVCARSATPQQLKKAAAAGRSHCNTCNTKSTFTRSR
jgi:hypothetical protein